MNFSKKIMGGFQKMLPSPMSIAILLTLLTFVLAVIYKPDEIGYTKRTIDILSFWNMGFWSLMEFTMQMILILVLGYVLALSKSINRFIVKLTTLVDTNAKAAALLSFVTILISLFNWGLGLVFGAIFARKIAEAFSDKGFKFNYGLLGAAAYSGMMVWHGGLSGSAPLKIAEVNHFLVERIGQISLSETIFSKMNLFASGILLIIIPVFFYLIGSKIQVSELKLRGGEKILSSEMTKPGGAERLDYSQFFSKFFALLILTIPIYTVFVSKSLSFINLNYINIVLFGLAILAQGSIAEFLQAAKNAIGSSVGILIQFPLYAGIMGVMKYSGLYVLFTQFFLDISTVSTFPFYTMLSAAIVNIFVPSGGGQWIIQGPIVVEAALNLGVSIPKTVMALAYGDQLTNMIQPFWALPLLGITGLKAKDIFPFSLILMILGILLFVLTLLLF
ncbi:MAG: short-chain fatty acid transporter [Bacteroidetes bacterium]|nr:MAG: short-chain fatty acid transporter [Bacteroidota bacterium]